MPPPMYDGGDLTTPPRPRPYHLTVFLQEQADLVVP